MCFLFALNIHLFKANQVFFWANLTIAAQLVKQFSPAYETIIIIIKNRVKIK